MLLIRDARTEMMVGMNGADLILSEVTADEVLCLLREQAALYGRLETYSSRQRKLVVEDDVGPLLSLLANRQKLSQELTSVAGRLAPIRHEWSNVRNRMTPAQQTEAETLLDQAGSRLRQVIADDERDARVLAGRKQAVSASIQSAHASSQAMSAYQAPVGRPNRLDCTDGDGS